MGTNGVPNTLRIVGGRWRGRRLPFPSVEGLRPTPDRIRETLFNWLQGMVDGARCLDLFAGSGALGLEALSRGAAEILLVERDARVATNLRNQLRLLGAEGQGRVVQGDALTVLAGLGQPHQLVFLDPPFRQGLIAPCLQQLAAGGWLAAGAWVYVESEAELTFPPLPAPWEIFRQRTAGQVAYGLVRWAGSSAT